MGDACSFIGGVWKLRVVLDLGW